MWKGEFDKEWTQESSMRMKEMTRSRTPENFSQRMARLCLTERTMRRDDSSSRRLRLFHNAKVEASRHRIRAISIVQSVN